MVKILIAGDFAPHGRIENLIYKEKYDEIFREVIPHTSQVDYSIVNLEAPVVESTSAKPIEKCGPNLKCDAKAITAIKYAGFDMVTLANNHFYDYGEDGVRDTINACLEKGLEFVGGGLDIEQASMTFYKTINGFRFAFINCCENEFSIAKKDSGGSNPINPIQQFYAINESRKNADYVIVIVHGGPEGYQYPTPRMKELYRYFIDSGADAVVNHHQHCYSGCEFYNKKPIIYGLGNFCFDNPTCIDPRWCLGYMVVLNFDSSKITIEHIPYQQGFTAPGIRILDKHETKQFQEDLKNINNTLQDDDELSERYYSFAEKLSDMYLITLEPYTNRYLKAARFRHMLPSTMNKKRALHILNYLLCESHIERMRYVVNRLCKSK